MILQNRLLARKVKPFFAMLAVALFVSVVSAYTWTGVGGNNNWTNPSNWGGGGYPQTSSDTAIFTSDATVTLDSGTSITVGYVSVAAGKTVIDRC